MIQATTAILTGTLTRESILTSMADTMATMADTDITMADTAEVGGAD